MTDTDAQPPASRAPVWEAGGNETVAMVAEAIVSRLRPQTALDVGWGTALLVDELRSRGVDARGIDVSKWAVAEELDEDFDVITCIEALQHLAGHDGQAAIANLCRHGRTIVFSSSADGFDDPANVNVQPSDYWIGLFAEQGFFRNLDHDASYVSPDAVLLERRIWTTADVAKAYERGWWQAHRAAQGDRATHDRLTDAAHAAALALETATAEIERLANEIVDTVGRLDTVSADRDRLSTLLVVERAMFESQLAAAQGAARELEALRNTKVIRYSSLLRRAYGLARRGGQTLLRSR